jgi:hypothetical protein
VNALTGLCDAHSRGIEGMRQLARRGGVASAKARNAIDPDNLRLEARRQLQELLSSSDARVRLSAARSLFSFGSQSPPVPDVAEPAPEPVVLTSGKRPTGLGDVLELARELEVDVPVMRELELENVRLREENAKLRSSS